MTSLSKLLASPIPSEVTAAQQKCYVTYHLSALAAVSGAVPHLTVFESRSIISASGTTGLRTWEAALHLGQYLCANPATIKGKRVLELGAGTGYLSLLCTKYLEAVHCLATDGSDDVITNLPDNIFLNGLQESDNITPMELRWGHALVGTEEATWNGGRSVDVVLGADVTYEKSVIPALVATLVEIVTLFPRAQILISATERNIRTFEAFQDATSRSGFTIETLGFKVTPRTDQTGPFYSDQIRSIFTNSDKTSDTSLWLGKTGSLSIGQS